MVCKILPGLPTAFLSLSHPLGTYAVDSHGFLSPVSSKRTSCSDLFCVCLDLCVFLSGTFFLLTSREVKVTQSCLTLCDPMDCIHGILQARILEWVAFPFPGDLPNPGIELGSPALQVDSLPTELWGKPTCAPISPERMLKCDFWKVFFHLLRHPLTSFFRAPIKIRISLNKASTTERQLFISLAVILNLIFCLSSQLESQFQNYYLW